LEKGGDREGLTFIQWGGETFFMYRVGGGFYVKYNVLCYVQNFVQYYTAIVLYQTRSTDVTT
jgi:hypothetical protein